MRDGRPYSDGSNWTAPQGYGQRVDQPIAGFYKLRMRGGGIASGVELRFGPPSDPLTGEEMDRHWRWLAFVNGAPIDFDRVWPDCTGNPIPELEYRRLCARQAWAEKAAPDSAYADPFRKRDPLSTKEPLPF